MQLACPILIVYQQFSTPLAQAGSPFQAKCNNNYV